MLDLKANHTSIVYTSQPVNQDLFYIHRCTASDRIWPSIPSESCFPKGLSHSQVEPTKVQKQYSVYFSPKKKKNVTTVHRSLWVVAGINDESSMALSSSSQPLATQSPPHSTSYVYLSSQSHRTSHNHGPASAKVLKHLKLIRHPLES